MSDRSEAKAAKARAAKAGANANVRRVNYSNSPLLASRTPPWRSKFLVALVGAGFVVLVARAAYVQIIGAEPEEGSSIPGIRKWPEAYLPKIYDRARVDQVESVSQAAAERMARRMAAEEGIFCGISAAGACEIALRISQTVENATIVFVVCDRGDRYLSTGVFPA